MSSAQWGRIGQGRMMIVTEIHGSGSAPGSAAGPQAGPGAAAIPGPGKGRSFAALMAPHAAQDAQEPAPGDGRATETGPGVGPAEGRAEAPAPPGAAADEVSPGLAARPAFATVAGARTPPAADGPADGDAPDAPDAPGAPGAQPGARPVPVPHGIGATDLPAEAARVPSGPVGAGDPAPPPPAAVPLAAIPAAAPIPAVIPAADGGSVALRPVRTAPPLAAPLAVPHGAPDTPHVAPVPYGAPHTEPKAAPRRALTVGHAAPAQGIAAATPAAPVIAPPVAPPQGGLAAALSAAMGGAAETAGPADAALAPFEQRAAAPLATSLAPATPQTMAAPDIPRQIALRIAQAAEGGPGGARGTVELSLSPEELGRVRLRLHPSEAGLSVTITAERPETLDLLRRNIDLLARDFREIGYEGTQFEFAQGGQGWQDGQDGPDPGPGPGNSGPAVAGAADPPLPAPPVPLLLGERLDLRL
jgi:hypothetical protein